MGVGAAPEETAVSTLSARAFAALRHAILAGEIAPGTRLEVGRIAAELAMSPMPVREAVRRLEALGLVEHRPHRGARVTELSVDDLREVYTARLAIEARAVFAAATRFTDEDAEQAAASLSRAVSAERAGDYSASWAADTQFHFALYRAAHSPWLVRLITPLWETSERYRRLSQSPSRDFTERYQEHMSILEACIARESEVAARRLGQHLARSANRLACALGSEDLFSETEVVLLPVPRPT